jgi:DNA polymerase-3 subunit delta
MAKQEVTYDSIIKEINSRQFAPVYYLMGEEPYYIDRLSDYIAEHVLTEEERGFNQMVIYGQDTDMASIVSAAKRYPMMAEHQVIIVKEAQALVAKEAQAHRTLDELVYYLQKPQPTTVLVFCHKYGTLDRRKKVTTEIEKTGRLFESKKLKDGALPSFISNYVRTKGAAIDVKATSMMADFIGADLNRLTSELDKLLIAKPKNDEPITPELVEDYVGISKDYNTFELKNALMVKDVVKANTIAKYMEDNKKQFPMPAVTSLLFNFYSNLMMAYYAPDKSENGIAAYLDLRNSWQARDYQTAMRYYTAWKVMYIISDIRKYDALSKGYGANATDKGLLRELIYHILH